MPTAHGAARDRAVAGRERPERVADGAADLVGADCPGDGDDGVAGAVLLRVEASDLVSSERHDRRTLAGGVAPQRMSFEDLPGELAVHHVVGRVVVHRQFLEDHLPFALDVAVADRGRRQHVAEQLDALDGVAGGEPAEERRVLLRRERVDVATDAVDGTRDLLRRAIGGALEQEMLEEMAHARLFG